MIRVTAFASLMAHEWREFVGKAVQHWRVARLLSAATAHYRAIEALGPMPADGPSWMSDAEKGQWRRFQIAAQAVGDVGVATEHMGTVCAARVSVQSKLTDIKTVRDARARLKRP